LDDYVVEGRHVVLLLNSQLRLTKLPQRQSKLPTTLQRAVSSDTINKIVASFTAFILR